MSRFSQQVDSDYINSQPPKRGEFDFENVNLEDPKVWNTISQGKTKGLFQLESHLGKTYANKLKPSSLKELAALVAILRPVCLENGMTDEFCDIKNGKKEISYLHPALEPILKDTFGIMVYQESIMEICKQIAGFTETQSDDMRKATGKKDPKIMMEVKKQFIEGCKKTNIVDDQMAEKIFGQMQNSVRYSFNASHSYSYATICYQTAYEKTHFPTEFYTACLIFSKDKIDPKEEIYELVIDAKMNGVNVYPPEISRGNKDFEIIGDKKISFGLSHIRGVADSAIKTIDRCKKELLTFPGFLKNAKSLHRNVCESLIKSGACDSYGISRTDMLRALHCILGRSERDGEGEMGKLTENEYTAFLERLNEGGTLEESLQNILDKEACVERRCPIIEEKIAYISEKNEDSNRRKALWESLYLGIALTCSAADDFEREEDSVRCKDLHKIAKNNKVILHAVIDKVDIRKTGDKAKIPGQEFASLLVSDNSGEYSVMMWPQEYEKYKDLIVENAVVSIYGRKDIWNGRSQVVLKEVNVLG